MDRIDGYLDGILKQRIAGTATHRAVGDFIVRKLKSLGYRVEKHEFRTQTPNGAKTFRNIVGTEDTKARRYLTLACHYDSKDCLSTPGMCASRTSDTFLFPAATDSALPCSLMLDVAASLQKHMRNRQNLDLSLKLLFLDGEEAFQRWTATDSLYGSRALAEKWAGEDASRGAGFGPPGSRATRLDQIDAFVLLDLLGAANPKIGNMLPNKQSLYLHLPMIEQKLENLPCFNSGRGFLSLITGSDSSEPIFLTSSYGNILDDHMPFYERGVPIVHLIPSPFPRVWHTEADNRDALHNATIRRLAAVLRVFVAQYLKLSV
jgi:glutaminyl-peptide cyclotransferase